MYRRPCSRHYIKPKRKRPVNPFLLACLRGLLEDVLGFLNGGADVNLKVEEFTPLIAACLKSSVEVVTVLLDAGAEVNLCTNIDSPLTAACEDAQKRDEQHTIVRLLLNKGADVNIKIGDRTPLLVSCDYMYSGGFDITKEILDAGANPNLTSEFYSPLILAALHRSKKGIELLLQRGADVNLQIGDRNPLIQACESGSEKCVELLIAAGVDVNVQLGDRNPLIQACESDSVECVEFLIAAGVDVNVQLGDRNPLIEACRRGSVRCVQELIATGVDVNVQLGDRNPLIEACRRGSEECVQALIVAGVDVNVQLGDRNPLIEACGRGSVRCVQELIARGVDVNVQLGDRNPLIEACRQGSEECVQALIVAGVDVNVQLGDRNPLIEACGRGSVRCVQELIARGVDVNVQLGDRNSLIEACGSGSEECVQALIVAGVDVNVQLGDRNPLIEACRRGSEECVQALIVAGVDVNVQLGDRNPLIETCRLGLVRCVQELIARGVDVNVQLGDRNPLIEACGSGSVRCVQELIATGVDVNVQLGGKTAADVNNRHISSSMSSTKVEPDMFDYIWLAQRFKIHEMLSMQNKEDTVERMKAHFKNVLNEKWREHYRRTVDYYIADLPPIKYDSDCTLTEDEENTRIVAFESGTEKNFNIRIHFVGYTTAGKTSLMLQMFTIPFDPSKISSTDGISISLYQCCIDIATREWYRNLQEEEIRLLQRLKNVSTTRPLQQTSNQTSLVTSGESNYLEEKLAPEAASQLPKNTNQMPDAKVNISKHEVDDRHLRRQLYKTETLYSEAKQNQASVRGFDHAGQTLYYALHQLFLSQKGTNIIVMDGSKNFDEIIKDGDIRQLGRCNTNRKLKDSVEGNIKGDSRDFFRFWANSLRYYLPYDNINQVIVVFTHKDLIKEEEALATKKDEIIEMISEMDLCDMFFDKIFSINCNNPDDEDLTELRRTVLDMNKRRKDWGDPMPNRWILLEDKLMKKREGGTKVMTLEEVETLNQTSAPALQSREEIRLFLKIQNENGTLIHFAGETLQTIVILEAQWLVDSLKAIIHAKLFLHPKFHKEWNLLHKKGILYKEFMERVWKENNDNTFYKFKDQLINLMEHLDLISSPQLYNDRFDDQVAPYFVVPCMLSTSPENFFSNYLESCSSVCTPLSYEFEHYFLPTATVYRLLAACISKYGESVDSNGSTFCDAARGTLFCNGGVFRVSERHFLLLEVTDASVIVRVTTFGQDHTEPEVCHQIRMFIIVTLDGIIANQKSSSKYTVAVSCGRGELYEQFQACKWEELIKEPSIVCNKHYGPPHVVKSKALLQQWLVRTSDNNNINGREENNVPKHTSGQPFHRLCDNSLTFPVMEAYVITEFKKSVGFLKTSSGSGTCFRVGTQRHVMTAYHVVKHTIDEMISQLAYRLIRIKTNCEQSLSSVADVLEVTHYEMDDENSAMESIFRRYFQVTPSEMNVSSLFARLSEIFNNDILDILEEQLNSTLWRSACTVTFNEQTTEFHFEYDIPFIDKPNDVVILKISGEAELPQPCILDTNNLPNEVECIGFPEQRLLRLDVRCPVYTDPESKQKAIQKAKQWWKTKCKLPISHQAIRRDFDIPESKIIVNTSVSFEHGASGSPMTKVDLARERPLVCMMYQCGFPEFYYEDKLSGRCQPPLHARFEGGISMRKISLLLTEAGKHELNQNLFPMTLSPTTNVVKRNLGLGMVFRSLATSFNFCIKMLLYLFFFTLIILASMKVLLDV